MGGFGLENSILEDIIGTITDFKIGGTPCTYAEAIITLQYLSEQTSSAIHKRKTIVFSPVFINEKEFSRLDISALGVDNPKRQVIEEKYSKLYAVCLSLYDQLKTILAESAKEKCLTATDIHGAIEHVKERIISDCSSKRANPYLLLITELSADKFTGQD